MSNATDPKTEKPTVNAREASSDAPVRKELSDAQLKGIVGGLNPQPLPPGRRLED